MKTLEFVHGGRCYRIELDNGTLTMVQRTDLGWSEVARLTMTAASILARLDTIVDPDQPAGDQRSRDD